MFVIASAIVPHFVLKLVLANGSYLVVGGGIPIRANTMHEGFKMLVEAAPLHAEFRDSNGKRMSPKAVREACE